MEGGKNKNDADRGVINKIKKRDICWDGCLVYELE